MPNEETAGEELIADFLEEKGIDFKTDKELPNLEEDNKFFRKPDFYLPKYNVYMEFLGQWNNPEHKKRYKQKMRVYHKNKIPCIYLWPDNLGILDWIIRRRMREVLLKYDKKWILLKYELENYRSEYGLILLGIVVLIYLWKDIILRAVLFICLLIILFMSIKKYLKRLDKLKKSNWVSGISHKKEG
jgi:hypothetical protein